MVRCVSRGIGFGNDKGVRFGRDPFGNRDKPFRPESGRANRPTIRYHIGRQHSSRDPVAFYDCHL